MTDLRLAVITGANPPTVRLLESSVSVPLAGWTEDPGPWVGERCLVGVRTVPGQRAVELYLMGILGGGTPAGVVMEFDGTTANIPAGWLVCDGSAVSRTTYARLFAAIGTLHGSGNGTTTFNLPDRRGRVGVGQATSGQFSTIGAKPGAEEVTLTVDQMPAHTHKSVSHAYIANQGWDGATRTALPAMDNFGVIPGIDSGQAAGGGQPHTNVQPSFVTNYIIKT